MNPYDPEATFWITTSPFIASRHVAANQPYAPFHLSNSSRIVVVSMNLPYRTQSSEQCCLVIPMQAITRRLGPYPSAEGPITSVRESLWTDWGKETRYLPPTYFAIANYGSRVCFVTEETTPEGRTLNTPVILNFAIPSRAIADSCLEDPTVTTVRGPTALEPKLLNEHGFLTTAPYEQVRATELSWSEGLIGIDCEVSLGEHSLVLTTPWLGYVPPTIIAHK